MRLDPGHAARPVSCVQIGIAITTTLIANRILSELRWINEIHTEHGTMRRISPREAASHSAMLTDRETRPGLITSHPPEIERRLRC